MHGSVLVVGGDTGHLTPLPIFFLLIITHAAVGANTADQVRVLFCARVRQLCAILTVGTKRKIGKHFMSWRAESC